MTPETSMQSAMLFPGQGAQAVGMGADVAAHYPEAARVMADADAVLGYALSDLMLSGPLETLTETRHAQPALLVHSVAVLHVLQARGIAPAIVAGHSLGEYSALVAAGSLTFEAALGLVKTRGDLMFDCGVRAPGAMAAVVGLEVEAVERACASVRAHGVCDLANLNAPDQVVISGAVPAVEAALPLLQQAGARIVKRLNVSGAFHSALMREPADVFAAALDQTEFRDAAVPVLTNVGARAERSGTELRALLKLQIASPVRWTESMQALRAHWPGPVLEVGSGSVLKGLLRRIDREAFCTAVGTHADIEALVQKGLPSASNGTVV